MKIVHVCVLRRCLLVKSLHENMFIENIDMLADCPVVQHWCPHVSQENMAAGQCSLFPCWSSGRWWLTGVAATSLVTVTAAERSLSTWPAPAKQKIIILIMQVSAWACLTVVDRPQWLSGVLVTSCVMWHVTSPLLSTRFADSSALNVHNWLPDPLPRTCLLTYLRSLYSFSRSYCCTQYDRLLAWSCRLSVCPSVFCD